MSSEIFLNSRNEAHLARGSIFVHLVTDLIFIYPFILYRLFYFILFHFILFYLLSFIDDQHFLLLFFIYFVIICPVPGCSGMFWNVPGCSMFRVLSTPLAISVSSSSATKIALKSATKISQKLVLCKLALRIPSFSPLK